MSDNYGINTTQAQSLTAGGLNPNDPSENFGQMVASASATQAEHEQLVQQAVERTKQAKIGTAEAQDIFDTKAYLSEKGLMPKAQALVELKIILEKQEMDDAQTKKIVSEAEAAWPEELDGAAIWRWFSALKEPKQAAAMHGAAFQATEDMKDQKEADGTPVVVGQWYQKNTDGDLVRTGQPPAEVTAGNKGGEGVQKSKTALVNVLVHELRAARGNWLSQGLYRCSVALQKLHETPFMTKQDLYQLAQDISAIFTGGVPTEDEILNSQYHTKLSEILSTLSSWTGHIMGLPLKDIREKLINVVQPLYDELIHRYTTVMDLAAQGHLDAVDADPEWWQQTKDKALQAAEHKQSPAMALPQGNMLPVGDANTQPTPAGSTHTSPGGHSYSVE